VGGGGGGGGGGGWGGGGGGGVLGVLGGGGGRGGGGVVGWGGGVGLGGGGWGGGGGGGLGVLWVGCGGGGGGGLVGVFGGGGGGGGGWGGFFGCFWLGGLWELCVVSLFLMCGFGGGGVFFLLVLVWVFWVLYVVVGLGYGVVVCHHGLNLEKDKSVPIPLLYIGREQKKSIKEIILRTRKAMHGHDCTRMTPGTQGDTRNKIRARHKESITPCSTFTSYSVKTNKEGVKIQQ